MSKLFPSGTSHNAPSDQRVTDGRFDLFVEGREHRTAGVVVRPIKGLRELRGAVLSLALWIDEDPSHRGLLFLSESAGALPKVRSEIARIVHALRQDIAPRFSVVWREDGALRNLPADLDADAVDRMVARDPHASVRRSVGHGRFWVFATLLRDWLALEPPRSIKDVQGITGLSYPTVAGAIDSFERWLTRGPYRRVGLREFPWPLWRQVVATADQPRETARFIDRSGIGRSADALVDRIAKLADQRIAFGGVIAANHYQPEVDLVGLPRLDVTVHQHRGEVDLGWVAQVDPALERTVDETAKASLVVHALRRQESLFAVNDEAMTVVDPAECIFDLADLRLFGHVDQMVERISRVRASAQDAAT